MKWKHYIISPSCLLNVKQTMESLMQCLRFQPSSMVVIVVMQNWKKPKKKKDPKFFDQGFYFQPKTISERTGKIFGKFCFSINLTNYAKFVEKIRQIFNIENLKKEHLMLRSLKICMLEFYNNLITRGESGDNQ
jgi:hypothetical protein